MSSLRHEGSDYPGFIDNDSRRDYEAILLAAYERSSPLEFYLSQTETSTVEEDLENIAEFADDIDYVERHHPLPKSLGGTKKISWQCLKLTFQEHFRVHQLLPEFTDGEDRRRMLHAFWRTATGKNGDRLTAEQYETAKRALREAGFSDETRAKISAANMGKSRPHSPETKLKMSATRLGRKHSPEHSAKIGAAHRGKKLGPLSPEAKQKLSAANKRRKERGWTISIETRRKISAAKAGKAGKPLSEEHRAAISARQLGMKHKTHRNKGQRLSAERLVRVIAANKKRIGTRYSPEDKAKMRTVREARRRVMNVAETVAC
jgi:hypothetical protein